jgi:hypothetical protein
MEKLKDNRSFTIYAPDGYKTISIGENYLGMGCSGMSDNVIITGTLIEFERSMDYCILQDERGVIHAVIPSTLVETKKMFPLGENETEILNKTFKRMLSDKPTKIK